MKCINRPVALLNLGIETGRYGGDTILICNKGNFCNLFRKTETRLKM